VSDQPDIASVAALVGHPGRARILLALMGGRALTATELALEADVTPQTASAHLAKLEAARLIGAQRQGRHRYFALADRSVAQLLEKLCRVVERRGGSRGRRVRTGPRDPALREARVCYDHLAGDLAVRIFDALVSRKRIAYDPRHGDGLRVTPAGERFFAGIGIDMDALARARRPTCRPCLDWSVRRHHLAGGLGAALLDRILARGLARRDPASRAVRFTAHGRERLERMLELPPAARAG
jgi:DNA-binding transcriptional ArsR family regulator